MNWFIEHWQETLLALFSGVAVFLIGNFIRKKPKESTQTVGKNIKAGGDVKIEKVNQKTTGTSHSSQTAGEDIEGKNITIKDIKQDSK
jgi:hypothetical protein